MVFPFVNIFVFKISLIGKTKYFIAFTVTTVTRNAIRAKVKAGNTKSVARIDNGNANTHLSTQRPISCCEERIVQYIGDDRHILH